MERKVADSEAPSCLLVVPRGQAVPLDLLDGLRRRRVALREVSEAPSALAELAAHRYTALVVIEPAAHPDAGALARVVAHYHPGVALWRYSGVTDPRLTRWADAAAAPPAENPQPEPAESRPAIAPITVEPKPPAPPDARRTAAASIPADSARKPRAPKGGLRGGDDEPLSPVTLSPEELAMLLGEEPPSVFEG